MAEETRRYYEGIGRRKRASARVRIYPDGEATGNFVVNGKDVKEYFPRFGDYLALTGPLSDTNLIGKMDVSVHIDGGGITGQTSARCVWVWPVPWWSTMRTCAVLCVPGGI
jgi:small subunit ribosomal protein S9